MNWRWPQFARSGRGIATILAALVLLLYFVRPGADNLRTRIMRSIGSAIGRRVEVSSVSLRFLPQPGFDLEDFVVFDEPAFGAEPVLRAQEVTAALRVTSLLRGRLEISRLSLTEPSLNLVRSNEGRWNFSGLVERAAKIPVAPTSKTKSEPRPGFPYIEASNGRINFKLGQEKKAFALMNADFSLWQDSENAWSVRLKAQPMRTDSNFSDTGTLRVEGSWQRSATLRETPLSFNAQWENAQLGQFTKMATGTDRGWRGTVLLSATVSGTPGDLRVAANGSIQDFRRYDIASGDALRLAAQCSARYDSIGQELTEIACNAPVGSGALKLSGGIRSVDAVRSYDLSCNVNDVPVSSVLALLGRAKKNIPDDLISAGKINADIGLHTTEDPSQPSWQGSGVVQDVRLLSRTNAADLTLARVPFAVGQESQEISSHGLLPRVDLGPVHLALGASNPANLRAWVSLTGYSLQIKGDTRIKNLLQAARVAGLSYARPAADGSARVDLQIAGAWKGFRRADITGNAQLANVHAEIGGVNTPLVISTATVTLRTDSVIAQNVSASLGQTNWRGSLSLPRHCEQVSACPIQFEFQTKELGGDQLAGLFVPGARKPWYRFLSSPEASNSFLSNLNAAGVLRVDRLTIHQVNATQVSSKVVWKDRQLQLSGLGGSLLGGNLSGNWTADFSADFPKYAGHGSVQHAVLGQLAQAMRDNWVTGTATASYEITASGASAAEFLSSVRGRFDIAAREVTLPHLVLSAGAGPVFAKRFTGTILLRGDRTDIQEGKLETGSGIYQISGTARTGAGLDLRMLKDEVHGYTITGPLATPRVAAVSVAETRAALKPQ